MVCHSSLIGFFTIFWPRLYSVNWSLTSPRRAAKVTTTLASHPNPLYRAIEVTTKHDYEINHKYLWICIGQPPQTTAAAILGDARQFLSLPDDDADPGCGAEYGRHSRSIDPEKHRCGKCKGLLAQVRPKPKLRQATSPRKAGGVGGSGGKMKDSGLIEGLERGKEELIEKLERAIDLVNLSD